MSMRQLVFIQRSACRVVCSFGCATRMIRCRLPSEYGCSASVPFNTIVPEATSGVAGRTEHLHRQSDCRKSPTATNTSRSKPGQEATPARFYTEPDKDSPILTTLSVMREIWHAFATLVGDEQMTAALRNVDLGGPSSGEYVRVAHDGCNSDLSQETAGCAEQYPKLNGSVSTIMPRPPKRLYVVSDSIAKLRSKKPMCGNPGPEATAAERPRNTGIKADWSIQAGADLTQPVGAAAGFTPSEMSTVPTGHGNDCGCISAASGVHPEFNIGYFHNKVMIDDAMLLIF